MNLLTLKECHKIFGQQLINLLGCNPDGVRKDNQQESGPFHKIEENVCYYYVRSVDDPTNRQIDTRYNALDETKAQQINSYNRVMELNITMYGDDAYDKAVLLRMVLLEPTRNWDLATKGLYIIPEVAEPFAIWEHYNNRWWPRVDMQVRYNNLVTDDRHEVHYLTAADITVVSEQQEHSIEVKEGE